MSIASAISACGRVEPERASGDQADLGVDLLDAGVGEAVLDRGEDPVALVGDRAGELDERRQLASSRPLQPGVEQPTRRGGGELVDLAQLLLEQVRAVQAWRWCAGSSRASRPGGR